MNSYSKRVADNLEHLKTPAFEWTAVATDGQTEVDVGEGKRKTMPTFNFPSGYEEAPSLYRNSSGQCCCNLCGEDIKNVYWIQNDTKKWIMPVGSECVQHFGLGLSGAALHSNNQHQAALDLMLDVKAAKAALWKQFTRVSDLGYDRKERGFPSYGVGARASTLYQELRACLGSNDPDNASKMTAARWLKKQRQTAPDLVAKTQLLLKQDIERKAQDEAEKQARGQSLKSLPGLTP